MKKQKHEELMMVGGDYRCVKCGGKLVRESHSCACGLCGGTMVSGERMITGAVAGKKKIEKWEREPLADEEITAIFDECSTTEERLIVAFLADTGCRVNELLRLNKSWDDEKIGKYGGLTVPVQATSGKKPKTKKPKTIPISKRLREVIDECQIKRGSIQIERTPQHIYNVVKRLAKRAGVTKHVTPHVFRHSFITRCYYKGGLKPEEIGALAGHRDGEMVGTVYLHIDSEKTRSKLEESGFLE